MGGGRKGREERGMKSEELGRRAREGMRGEAREGKGREGERERDSGRKTEWSKEKTISHYVCTYIFMQHIISSIHHHIHPLVSHKLGLYNNESCLSQEGGLPSHVGPCHNDAAVSTAVLGRMDRESTTCQGTEVRPSQLVQA